MPWTTNPRIPDALQFEDIRDRALGGMRLARNRCGCSQTGAQRDPIRRARCWEGVVMFSD